ncbi:MAG: Antitoxin Phd YefM, type toxin-antitoxin system [Deltaproteobacteria bacterium]|jgi:prevent-host-death family protein|nr:Antitoxin Phd YefM, type toxin-antitoxin system [Deltaproteobacteria bacterium]
MPKRMSAREARDKFADLVGSVHYGGEEIIVERSGRPVAAVIPVTTYERLVAERRARFEVLDRIRSRLPELSPEEIEADVTKVVTRVRRKSAPRRP